MRRLLLLGLVIACAATVTACGSMRNTIEPTAALASPVSVELASAAAGGQAGLLTAGSDGNMARAGIRLTTRTPASPGDPLADVLDSRVDVAIMPEPELMLARSAGDYVLGFGTLTQASSDAIVTLARRHIRSVADLKGRTVATNGLPYEKDILDAILTRAQVPVGSVHLLDAGSDLSGALRSGRAAAAFGDGESIAVPLRDRRTRVDLMSVQSLHVPAYSDLVFVTRETYFANNVDVLRRFVQASGRGAAALRADPSTGGPLLRAGDPSLSSAQATALVGAALPSAFPGDGYPWGWQNQTQWNTFGGWMTAHHLLSGPTAWYDASTNQLLAGQGP